MSKEVSNYLYNVKPAPVPASIETIFEPGANTSTCKAGITNEDVFFLRKGFVLLTHGPWFEKYEASSLIVAAPTVMAPLADAGLKSHASD